MRNHLTSAIAHLQQALEDYDQNHKPGMRFELESAIEELYPVLRALKATSILFRFTSKKRDHDDES